MTRRLPPLNALRAFEAAARHLSFTAAADELCVTHGAISRQVKTLELTLGVLLFRRLNRRIELTEAGEALLPTLRTTFDLIERSVAQIDVAHRHGPLDVSCLATFTMKWLIPRLHHFKAVHPDIDVRLTSSDRPVDFQRDGVDVAIRVGAPPWPDEVVAMPFLEERVGPVLSEALLRRVPVTTPAMLRAVDLLHTDTRGSAWADWLTAAGVSGIDPLSGQHFEHFYFLIQAAASGLGAAIVPEALVADDLASGRLVAPFGFLASQQSYTLLCPKTTAAVPKIVAFRDWLLGETDVSRAAAD